MFLLNDSIKLLLVSLDIGTSEICLSPSNRVATAAENDVSFEDYRDITYARLDKKLVEQGTKPKTLDSLKLHWKYFVQKGSTSSC